MKIVVTCLEDAANGFNWSICKIIHSDRLQRFEPTFATHKFVAVVVEKFTFAGIPAKRCNL
jgi:hypothetical protein